MEVEFQKEYFFQNLIHMGFIGKVCPKTSRPVLTAINSQLEGRLKDIDFSLSGIHKQEITIEVLISAVFSNKHFVDEYCDLFDLLITGNYEEALIRDLTNFNLSKISASGNEVFSIKSNSPDGNLTRLKPFDYHTSDSAIYVDVFTVPQFHNSQIVGFQGIFSVANSRRHTFLKNKKDTELHIFHNLIVDMPNRSTSILKSIQNNNTLDDEIKGRLKLVSDYLDQVITQSKDTLKLYAEIGYSEGEFKDVNISNLIMSCEEIIKSCFVDKKININYAEHLYDSKTLLSKKGIEFILIQVLENSYKEYSFKKIPKSQQLIDINFNKVILDKREALEFSVLTHNTSIKSKKVLNDAGKRPLQSSTSSGLGFYFMNSMLELLKANLPINDKSRHFDLLSSDEGVYFNIYFYLR